MQPNFLLPRSNCSFLVFTLNITYYEVLSSFIPQQVAYLQSLAILLKCLLQKCISLHDKPG